MRSRFGVGMTPPNVLGAPKPTSSVMINNTLGALLGGTTRGAHHAFDWAAFSLITPPNLGSGGGSCFPSIVVVALAEPKTPVICWAAAGAASIIATRTRSNDHTAHLSLFIPLPRLPNFQFTYHFGRGPFNAENPGGGAKHIALYVFRKGSHPKVRK